MKCPNCGSDCERDEVDVGIGNVPTGPWGCPECHWVEQVRKVAVIGEGSRHLAVEALAKLAVEGTSAGTPVGLHIAEPREFDPNEVWIPTEEPIAPENGPKTAGGTPKFSLLQTRRDRAPYVRDNDTNVIRHLITPPKGKKAVKAAKKARRLARESAK